MNITDDKRLLIPSFRCSILALGGGVMWMGPQGVSRQGVGHRSGGFVVVYVLRQEYRGSKGSRGARVFFLDLCFDFWYE